MMDLLADSFMNDIFGAYALTEYLHYDLIDSVIIINSKKRYIYPFLIFYYLDDI